VKAMASRMIPVLQSHLETARQLARSTNVRMARSETAKKS
jgi:hypothetical protein